MRQTALLFIVILLISSCESRESVRYSLPSINVSGEFLFEGPNTLQGQPNIDWDQLVREMDLPDNIEAIYVTEATISFAPDSLQSFTESALIQWVADELPLVSVATRSPLPADGSVSLEVNGEQEILHYLKDPSATLVVDVNLNKDLDYLEGMVQFQLNVEY